MKKKVRATSRRQRKDKWGNRMAIIGITLVVGSLAVVVNVRGVSLKDKAVEYQVREDSLKAQLDQEMSGLRIWRKSGSMYRPNSTLKK